MEITTKRLKGIKDLLIIRLKGKLISIWAREFEEYLNNHILNNGFKSFIINLKETTFIDTPGLNTLKSIQDRGFNLALSGVGYNVAVIFGYTKAYETFRIFSTEEEALAYFGLTNKKTGPAVDTKILLPSD